MQFDLVLILAEERRADQHRVHVRVEDHRFEQQHAGLSSARAG